jgi:hypothetical protein
MHGTQICSVDGCGRKHKAKGLCNTHHRRQLRGGDPTSPIGSREGYRFPPGTVHPYWRGETVGYFGAHLRLYRTRGPAKRQSCAHCGGAAKHWAYDHTDPSPLIHTGGRADGRLYSTDPARYIALCGSCHKFFDAAHRGR